MNLRTVSKAIAETSRSMQVDVKLLESLFDHLTDATFFVKDAAGRYVMVNDSLVERHGLKSKAEAMGKRPSDICPGELGRRPDAQDARVLRTGRALVDHLELHLYQPHRPGWCLTTKMPIRDADGAVIGIIGYSRDVRVPIETDEIPSDFAMAMRELEEKLLPEMSAAWLAEQSKMSTQRLARLTKRLFGLTPTQLITKTRIAAASRMLTDSDTSVSTIAQACGFYDHSAFTRAFRRVSGVTPSQFRRDD